MAVLVAEHASKSIKGRRVLDDINLTLEDAGIYGFFGVNGSGKTMLFRAISGLITLDDGSITVFDKRIGSDVSFPDNIGIALGASFWDDFSGFSNLKMLASIKGIASDDDVKLAMRRLGLDPDDGRPYKAYSLGMRQRLELAQAVMEKPKLLVLDEPTNALDSSGINQILDVIRAERDRGATVLVTAHNVAEIEALCDRSFEMSNGSIEEKL